MLATAVALVITATAVAETGDITPQDCVADAGIITSCTEQTSGLQEPSSVVVSPDGKSVYAAGSLDDAVVHMSRNTTTGAIAGVDCVDDNDTGPDTCGDDANGLDGARSVAISPDGESVYVASDGDHAIAEFDRNPADGTLTPSGCIDDDSAGVDCPASMRGLAGVTALAVSPDGEQVYAVSETDNAIVQFNRDSDGDLTGIDCERRGGRTAVAIIRPG